MTRPKKIYVRCSHCRRKVWRRLRRKVVCCPKCKRASASRWYENNKAHVDSGRYWREHKAERSTYMKAWRGKHLKKIRRYNRAAQRRCAARRKAVLDSIPCLDCGMNHSPERREAILRRMLPCSAADIHEAWPCFWGVGGQANKSSAGTRMLVRDLKAAGAVRLGGTWYSPAEIRSAA